MSTGPQSALGPPSFGHLQPLLSRHGRDRGHAASYCLGVREPDHDPIDDGRVIQRLVHQQFLDKKADGPLWLLGSRSDRRRVLDGLGLGLVALRQMLVRTMRSFVN